MNEGIIVIPYRRTSQKIHLMKKIKILYKMAIFLIITINSVLIWNYLVKIILPRYLITLNL